MLSFTLFFSAKAYSQTTITVKLQVTFPADLKVKETNAIISAINNKQEKFKINSDTIITLKLPLKGIVNIKVVGEFIKTREFYLNTNSLFASKPIEVKLEKSTITLETVVIKSQITFAERKDTLQISASGILTRPHADSGELLNNIPGVSVSANGQITAMGKKVRKVTVDGKELFGGNSKATIDAIKSDMIQGIQIVNSGLATDQSEINLVLKEDKKEGKYGTVSALAGLNNRYNTGVKINSIKPSTFFNFFLNNNNTYEKAISDMDYLSMVNFNMENSVAGSQKIYYNHQLENSFENVERLLKRGDFDIGTMNNLSAGLSYHKTTDKLNWSNFVLTERPNASFNRTLNNTNLIFPYTVNSSGSELSNSLDYITTAESSLKWKINENNTINGKVTLNSSDNSNTEHQNTGVVLSDEYGTALSQDNLLFDRTNDKKSNLFHIKGSWEHRYETPSNKTTLIAGSLNKSYKAKNQYMNDLGSDDISSNQNLIDQHLDDHLYYGSISQSILLFPKLLLDFNLSGVIENTYLQTDGFNESPTSNSYSIRSPFLSAGNVSIPRKKITGQAFLYYKTSKWSAVASSGLLWNDWGAIQNGVIINRTKQYVFLPNIYTNYSFNDRRSTVSFTHTTLLIDPLLEQVNPVYDSTYVQRVTVGNASLIPFVQKNFTLNGSSLIKGVGSINAQLSYVRSRTPVINSNTLEQSFPLTRYTQKGEAEQVNAILSLFRYQAESKINTNLMLIYLWKRQDQEVNSVLRQATLNSLIINAGLKWKIKQEHKLNLDLYMTFNRFNTEGLNGNNGNYRFLLKLNNEHKLPFNVYGQIWTKWLILQDANTPQVFRPIVDFHLAKYLLQQQSLMLKLGMANALNIESIKTIRSSPDQINSIQDFYLPRYPYLGITFYPEIWKKKGK